MKTKPILLILLLAGTNVFATEGINFLSEETKFQEVLAKAREEKKIIFIDAYTTWCGPCKWLDKNVFSDPEVGSYFNENFISAKFDMEKGEGLELAKKYNVNAYPTLLFLNEDGELLHRFCGSSNKEAFLKKAALALDEEERLGSLISRYEGGERAPGFLRNMLLKGAEACMDMADIAQEYWKQQPQEEWASMENQVLFQNYVKDFESEQFQYFLANYEKFLENGTGGNVEEYADRVLYASLAHPIYNKDSERLNMLREKIGSVDLPIAKKALNKALILEHQRAKEWNKLADAITGYIDQFGNNPAGYINSLSWNLYENVEEPAILEQASKWMEDLLKKEENRNYAYTDTYAALLLKSGQLEKGKKAANEAITIARGTGEDFSGTVDILNKYTADAKK